MSKPEFPPNNEVSKKGTTQRETLEPVVSSGVSRRKKSLRKQFSEVFVAGDLKSAIRFTIFDVILPSSKDLVFEAGQSVLEKLLFGEGRRRGSTRPQVGDKGYVAYNRMSGPYQSAPQRVLSRQARARHNFDEIVLDNRTEAEEVLERLFDIVSKYDRATVADLYELVGLSVTHTDHRWGWEDLHGAGVSRIRGGYLLDLPEPEPLD